MTSREAGAWTPFTGYPSGGQATTVPSVFFAQLLPQLEDPAELRVAVYLFYALSRRKGYPHFVTLNELRAETPLLAALGQGDDELALERLEQGLDALVSHGGALCLDVTQSNRTERLYLLNTPSSRRAVQQVRDGRLALGRALPAMREAPASQRASVYQLYEENIGPLSPVIAEELKEAEELYPFEWLEEAIKETALQNKRSWRYTTAILQRWATEGRKREKAGRDPGEGNSARAQLLRRYRDLGR